MGGCRCYFRSCHVSSQKFPGLHFFRFPLKEAERYEKWRQYSQTEYTLKYSEVRRRNTSICARHFRPECFMNYKMDRITNSAVPTIMRLSEGKALDFELDVENGVLVNIEEPKLKHLIPPDGFQSPLLLTHDQILIEQLNDLQSQHYNRNDQMELVEFEQIKYEIKNNPPKTNSLEILESIQVAAPSLKRLTQKSNDGKGVNSVRGKKCRILNTSNRTVGNDIKNVSIANLAPTVNAMESEEIHFVDTIQIDNQNEFLSEDDQLFITSESFINDDDCDEDLEIVHVHDSDLNSQLLINDSDASIVQLKSQILSNCTASGSMELSNSKQKQLLEQQKQEFDTLHLKYSLLEKENKDLKKDCQQIELIKRNKLLLQVENNDLKKSLEELNLVRDRLRKYSEENQKLKNEVSNTKTLKAELISRREENKELKKVLESLREAESKRPNIEVEIKNKEISGLRKNLELLQQQLNDTVYELKESQAILNSVEKENDRLIKQENKLKKSIENEQINFNLIKSNFEDLQLKHTELEQKCWKLQALKNQETTVSTSLEKDETDSKPVVTSAPSISVSSLTKAQLFNGIKRYLCSSMVSLLRMEMFGNTEREWKTDERQVAVDILRLGEMAYKYFTDEWRIRLPALRDAREWLTQSQQLMDDEEEDL